MTANKTVSIENYFIDQMKAANLVFEDNLAEVEIDDTLLAIIPESLAVRYHILPVSQADDRLVLVTDTEQAYKARAEIEKELQETVKMLLTTEENMRAGMLRFYQIQNYKQIAGSARSLVDTTNSPLQSAIVSMLQTAARDGASDIHLLPYSDGIYVHFRIHGHLYDMTNAYKFSGESASNIISLVKQMDESHNMDQTRTNMPNEGSFSIPLGNEDVFVRMETVPINGGTDGMEEVALRLLPQFSAQNSSKLSLENIGYTDDDLRHIKRMLYKSATGLFINSGPTGAGKTSSLYAQINHLLDAFREPMHVITIDDPIEIREERFTQVQVRKVEDNEKLSLTADKILVSALRLDPDVILYNEIRNATDARAALRASTTGHRVFSTVHAADCIATISRLLDLDIPRTMLLSELRMIISQRLVARLCPYCSKKHLLTEEERLVFTDKELEKLENGIASGKYRLLERGSAEDISKCDHCNHHGYQGRFAIAEFLEFDRDIRDGLLRQPNFSEIEELLKQHGFRSIWQKGMNLVIRGEIELWELIRVLGKE